MKNKQAKTDINKLDMIFYLIEKIVRNIHKVFSVDIFLC